MLRTVVTINAILLSLLLPASAVDKSNFKKCDQSSFCKRNRALTPGDSPYSINPDSLAIEGAGCEMDIVSERSEAVLRAELFALEGNMFRLRIKEKDPIRPRYEVEGALVGEPKLLNCQVHRSSGGVEVVTATGKATVNFDPFRVDFSVNNEIAVVVNSRGLMNFEHYRTRKSWFWKSLCTAVDAVLAGLGSGFHFLYSFFPSLYLDPPIYVTPPPEQTDDFPEDQQRISEEEEEEEEEEEKEEDIAGGEQQEKVEPIRDEEEEKGMWEEKFKTHHDSKPYGPSSIGMDMSFPGVDYVYGIPEHADSLALKATNGGGDPYRLYNLDVFEYELDSEMALYGSIPLMLAHNWSKTVGVFWHNAAETWVELTNAAANKHILGKLLSYFKSDEEVPQVDTHWISESGVIDIFILLGPRPYDVFQQYSTLTGFPPIPPLFSIAYHQSRWNYNDEEDVSNVDAGFDEHDFPYDVLWLDIEHTDGKRYFTWDSAKFPDSAQMISKLAAKGRKMVAIIDPHIKRDSNYHIHKEADSKDLYVKKADGSVYEGWCWPGTSSWIDFLNPAIRQWWAEQFAVDKYKGSTVDLFTWNDMNEPSVFNGPEITMHKDAKHYGDWEHRDVHNIYGMLQQQATAEGQVMRTGGKERPFVLSRAFFAGSQRFGAIWTGDNAAEWSHLKISIPMMLSVSIAGLPFVGADVGGFFKNPDPELLVRWYQLGAFYPFFRAHAHMDTRRREPWLFDADKFAIMRAAVRMRYELLPFWYTLFYQSSKNGVPVVRPLWVEFPRDKNTYEMETQFLVGSSLMVCPVIEQYATSVQIYLPGATAVWYDVQDYTPYNGGIRHSISAPLEKIPVFQRGGTIVPKKLRVRRCSALMANDPYTLVVALNSEGGAKGSLYVDDGHSFEYQNGAFLLREFVFQNDQLTSRSGDPNGSYETPSWLERVIIAGYPHKPKSVKISSDAGADSLLFLYTDRNKVLVIRKPGLNIGKDFTITINS